MHGTRQRQRQLSKPICTAPPPGVYDKFIGYLVLRIKAVCRTIQTYNHVTWSTCFGAHAHETYNAGSQKRNTAPYTNTQHTREEPKTRIPMYRAMQAQRKTGKTKNKLRTHLTPLQSEILRHSQNERPQTFTILRVCLFSNKQQAVVRPDPAHSLQPFRPLSNTFLCIPYCSIWRETTSCVVTGCQTKTKVQENRNKPQRELNAKIPVYSSRDAFSATFGWNEFINYVSPKPIFLMIRAVLLHPGGIHCKQIYACDNKPLFTSDRPFLVTQARGGQRRRRRMMAPWLWTLCKAIVEPKRPGIGALYGR